MIHLSVVLSVLLSLVILILVQRKTGKLLPAALIASVFLMAAASYTFQSGILLARNLFTQTATPGLLLVILMVMWLSTQMKDAGIMDQLVREIRSVLSNRYAMAALPGIIGLLPMPGGAWFSAPMVDSCDETGVVSPNLKNITNYWFRHSWEFWWPLYPGVLLTMEITNISLSDFLMVQMPLSAMALFGGYLFLLRKIPRGDGKAVAAHVDRRAVISILRLTSPLVIIILVYGFIGMLFDIKPVYALIAGISIGMVYIQVSWPLSPAAWKRIIVSQRAFNLALIVLCIRLYGFVIESPVPGGQPLMKLMGNELASYGVPAMALIILLPFISGISTGLAVGFAGASMPVVNSLYTVTGEPFVAVVMLAYLSGYIGMMLSPVHVCFIVSSSFFSVDLLKSLTRLVRPALLTMVTGSGYYLVIRNFF